MGVLHNSHVFYTAQDKGLAPSTTERVANGEKICKHCGCNKLYELVFACDETPYDEQKPTCEYFAFQPDQNGDIALTYCGHPDNPEDVEGNCNFNDCPLITIA